MRGFMFLQSVKMAGHAVLSNKLRSFLTMLGIIIGVVSLVVLVSLVDGASSAVADEIASMGKDLLTVNISDDKGSPLKLKELEQVEDLEEISLAAPLGQSSATGEYGGTSNRMTLYGTTAAYSEIQGMEVAAGRFLKTFDVEAHTFVAVISQTAAEEFFGSGQTVGEYLGINGKSFLVIGVLAEEGTVKGDTSERLEAYIPYTTLQRVAEGVSGVTGFSAKATDEEDISPAENALNALLLERFSQDEEAFTIVSQSTLMETMGSVDHTFALLLGGIAGISLLVGGIGIMNIMLVSVTERTREIGIRKAIGATRESIMLQFMMEALLISLAGCGIGVAFSWMIVQGISLVTEKTFHLSGQVLLAAVGFSAAIGLGFGLYPAGKAAKKQPIEALRHRG